MNLIEFILCTCDFGYKSFVAVLRPFIQGILCFGLAIFSTYICWLISHWEEITAKPNFYAINLDEVWVFLRRGARALCVSNSGFQQPQGLQTVAMKRLTSCPLNIAPRAPHQIKNQNLLCASAQSNQLPVAAYIISFLAKAQNLKQHDPTSRTNFLLVLKWNLVFFEESDKIGRLQIIGGFPVRRSTVKGLQGMHREAPMIQEQD